MSRSRTVYVSSGATVDEVRAAVDAYMQRAGRTYVTDIEFADEYPGFHIGIDVYRQDEPEADARQIAAGISPCFPTAQWRWISTSNGRCAWVRSVSRGAALHRVVARTTEAGAEAQTPPAAGAFRRSDRRT